MILDLLYAVAVDLPGTAQLGQPEERLAWRELHTELLDQGRRDEPEALRAGLAWLEAAAAAYPEIARALAMGLSSAPA